MATIFTFLAGAILFFGGIATFSPFAAIAVGGFFLMIASVMVDVDTVEKS